MAKEEKVKKPLSMSVQDYCDPKHYKADKVETIEILEEIVANPERSLTPQQRYNIAQAVKYLLRCGLKGGVCMVEVDLQKAENYIHRAMTGQWIDRSFLDGSGKG